MIKIETLSGEPYQIIYSSENDYTYRDLVKYIKKPISKYPEYEYSNIKKYSNKDIFKVYVKTKIKFFDTIHQCEISLKEDIDYNKDILTIFFNFEYCCHLSEKKIHLSTDINNIDEELYKLYKSCLEYNGTDLQYVPEKLKNFELCHTALQNSEFALKYFPDNLKTEGLCRTCVDFNGETLEYFPISIINEDICRIAVKNTGCALQFVPDYLKTEEICRISVDGIGDSLEYVPDNLKTYNICQIAVLRNNGALQFVPDKWKTKELS